jgi:pimeloyl-ACP methyl ester carboxylesterase
MIAGPTSHTYTSQRLRLHYVDWGTDGLEPLLMIHGGRDHCRNWDWVAARMRDRYHVLAMDLRGHGDSAWAIGGAYTETSHIQDIAQLVHQRIDQPVTLMAHSLGALLSLAYAGVFPEKVARIIAIEGIPPVRMIDANEGEPVETRVRQWIELRRDLSGKPHRRYPSFEDAVSRMREANKHLSLEQARHLTRHGAQQNEDGSYSWKFDPYARFGGGPDGLSTAEQHHLWGRISCPVLLVRGAESSFPDPAEDGRMALLDDATLATVPGAGHWVHHDQLELFMAEVWRFLDS